jgi:hypothetical protein
VQTRKETHKQVTFAFRKGHTIGDIAAETDQLLATAFVDTGDLRTIQDTRNPKSVLVGRVGAGKTALLLQLKRVGQRVIEINPAALSLRYLSNTSIVPSLSKMGVHLEPFYQLLWRHILVMELIRNRFNLRESDATSPSLFERMSRLITMNAGKRKALEYYGDWNPAFWEEADVRVREITKTFQDKLKAVLGSSYPGIQAGFEAGQDAGQVEKTEMVQRIQRVVSEISIERINAGLDILKDHVLNDEQKPYYIIVDDLDKNWVDAAYSYDLIDALLEVVAEFVRLPNVKVVVALRENIFDALLSRRGRQRQQREKVERLSSRLHWAPESLVHVVDLRLKELLRGFYGGEVTLETLLPPRPARDGTTATSYIVERTYKRPRDIIDFVNRAIEVAASTGKHKISWEMIRQAERAYSSGRLRSLEDEWYDNYGDLSPILHALERTKDGFTVSDLPDDALLGILLAGEVTSDELSLARIAYDLHQAGKSEHEIWKALIPHLLKIGVLGIKQSPSEPILFWYDMPDLADGPGIETRYFFHPALYEALKVKAPARGRTIQEEGPPSH